MANLNVKYLGLNLKNPIIIGASNLVTDLKILKELENAGASAIVYKSLFEEQVQLEELEFDLQLKEYSDRHAEMISLFPEIAHAGPQEHLLMFKKAKDSLNIPLIASLNCTFTDTWIEYAKKLEEAGAAALELNFFWVPSDFNKEPAEIENEQLSVLKEILKTVKIPVSVKLSPFYSNPLNLIKKMDQEGVKGFVLFNKLFQPDINIQTREMIFPYNLSDPDENRLTIRFAGLLHGNINASICCNTGIYTGEDVIKTILAGADCVQVVSTIYKHKPAYVSKMLEDIEKWMDDKKYNSPDEFRGSMSKKYIKDPYAYKRAQYVDILMKANRIFDKYPLR
ncbi:MAG TPA: dihydroorotate dehydrogenase-like protein [Bacteroidia bacterium]|nr:dihydroorotate dehydrogenase-like protein [Bacteroidia bacterium]HRS57709.1 dihydroorotate dehydrogenase-like protein [Bacteroidia bacterium]HRU67076.1 dihydroorotate dehydrogenase-like protein [Bacteroidia bacterium]